MRAEPTIVPGLGVVSAHRESSGLEALHIACHLCFTGGNYHEGPLHLKLWSGRYVWLRYFCGRSTVLKIRIFGELIPLYVIALTMLLRKLVSNKSGADKIEVTL
jgi:hypothetical protein